MNKVNQINSAEMIVATRKKLRELDESMAQSAKPVSALLAAELLKIVALLYVVTKREAEDE